MRLHPRYMIVKAAELEIQRALGEILQQHDITHTELLRILASLQLTWANYALRAERHPDNPDRKADEE